MSRKIDGDHLPGTETTKQSLHSLVVLLIIFMLAGVSLLGLFYWAF